MTTPPNPGGRPTIGRRIVGDIRLDNNAADALDAHVAATGVSRAQTIREAIAQYLTPPPPVDTMVALLWRWLDFADAVSDTARDPQLEAETRQVLD